MVPAVKFPVTITNNNSPNQKRKAICHSAVPNGESAPRMILCIGGLFIQSEHEALTQKPSERISSHQSLHSTSNETLYDSCSIGH